MLSASLLKFCFITMFMKSFFTEIFILFSSAAGRGGADSERASGDGLQAAAPDRLSAPAAGGQGATPAISEAARGKTPSSGGRKRASAQVKRQGRGSGIEAP